MSDSLLKKILFAALSLNVLMLLLNLFIGPAENVLPSEMSKLPPLGSADSVFKYTLREFNVADSLTNFINKRGLREDTLSGFYNLSMPGDIRLPEFLFSLQANAKSAGFNISATEQDAARFQITITSAKTNYLLARLKQLPGIRRKACSAAFFIYLIPGSTIAPGELNNLPVGFYPLIKCNRTTLPIHQTLVSENGGYGVFLDNNFTDVEFRLDFAFSNQRFNSALDNIFTFFSGMKFMVISSEANYYLPSTLQKITTLATSRRISVFGTGFIVDLRNNSSEIVKDEVELLISRLGSEEAAYFLLDDYSYIRNEKMLLNLRKKGVKLLPFQSLVKRAALNPPANN